MVSPEPLTGDDIALGQGLADMATIGLLQQRAVHEQVVLAEQLQSALNSRVLIEQAKGMLAERHGLDPADAFTLMRTYARRTGSPLLTIAQRVIEGDTRPRRPQARMSRPARSTPALASLTEGSYSRQEEQRHPGRSGLRVVRCPGPGSSLAYQLPGGPAP